MTLQTSPPQHTHPSQIPGNVHKQSERSAIVITGLSIFQTKHLSFAFQSQHLNIFEGAQESIPSLVGW